MGEEPSAHGRRMHGREEGCSTRSPLGHPWAGGEAALVRRRDSRRAQAHPPLVTEQSQQLGNPVLSYLGQETDAAWRRKHLKKISAPCASPGRNPAGTGGAGWKRPDLAPVRAGAAQLGAMASPTAASAGIGAQRAFFLRVFFYFSLEAWRAEAAQAQLSCVLTGKVVVPSFHTYWCQPAGGS